MPAAVTVVGAGPSGLMAAEQLLLAGHAVQLFDAMPSPGRKFLLAGIGGLNITHSEPETDFLTRFGAAAAWLQPALTAFPPSALRDWVHALGVETFVGSSGRVFPREMKAAPLLRRWLQRLRGLGLQLHVRHRLLRWQPLPDAGGFRCWFQTPQGERTVDSRALVLALGGGSWARLGSDGRWLAGLEAQGIACRPLRPANVGFERDWQPPLQALAGSPLKSVALQLPWRDPPGAWRLGEIMLTRWGLEGSLIYAESAAIRDRIDSHGQAEIRLDLLPARSLPEVAARLARGRPGQSLARRLRALSLDAAKTALLHEVLKQQGGDPAERLKSLPLTLHATRPIDEAISTAGGVALAPLDASGQAPQWPGLWLTGEMLDWEAPTGGYLLTACLATGRMAGQSAARWLQEAWPPAPHAL